VDVKHKSVIRESGYFEFPYMMPSWSRAAGEIYGRSPSLNNLADIKTLNKMKKTLIRAGNRVAEPPVNVPSDMDDDPDLTPNGVNHYESGTRDRVEPILLGAHLPITLEMIERQADDIRDGYLVTQLSLIDRREMTAEEVRTRTLENAMILGPTFDRLQSEFLERLVYRIIGILGRAGELEDMPEKLKDSGGQPRMRYVSPLARAQRLSEVQAIDRVVATALDWSEKLPDVLDNVDPDVAIRELAEVEGSPADMMRSEDAVKKIRDARRKVREQAVKLQQAESAAGAAKDLAAARPREAA